jgi:mitochondrial fusion and transport protein UGO1
VLHVLLAYLVSYNFYIQSSDSSGDQDGYFIDPVNPTPVRYPRPRLSNEHGYIIRRSVLDEDTRPEYLIPVAISDGVWGMIKRVARSPNEGWLALWKGSNVHLCLSFLSSHSVTHQVY